MLRVRGVGRRYPEFDLALDFAVERGELVSVLGPSGSGKTTTLRIIAGFERPDRGVVEIDGREVTSLPPEKRRVGFVFQDYTLFPHMDVFHNVAYGLSVRGEKRSEIERAVSRYLELVGLEGFGLRDVQTLSGGEQQRVAIARSLASAPLLLLLDEPFSSIDTVLRKDLRRQMTELQRELGITMLFVTHNQEEALAISDRVIVMQDGRIAQIGSPGELYRGPTSRFVAGFVGEASFLEGTISRAGDPERGIPWHVKSFGELQVLHLAPGLSAPEVGDRVSVMVRPSSLRFGSEAASGTNLFPVRIVEREYYGHYFEYACVVDLPPAGPVRLVAYDGERREIGARLTVSFGQEDAVLLPAEGAE